ncbi:DNA photolyase, FAD-binding/Cryptochrome [Pilobolus umbonatus]|nr:DNA photolyase, FAD-binding/Cryptochrome [Pilobolus umbonatus]
MRVHDNLPLYHAIQSSRKTHGSVLPVIFIDPRQVDISSLNSKLNYTYTPPKTYEFHLDRCATFRTRFIIESIVALRHQLKKRDSDLLILFGNPEEVLPKVNAFFTNKDYTVDGIYTDKEYAHEELQSEKILSRQLPNIKYEHDSFMVHPGDVDFTFEKTSKVFTHFRKRIEKMEQPVRPLVMIPDKLPPFPDEAWEIPHAKEGESLLKELYETTSHSVEQRSVCAWEGGEEIGQKRLQDYLFTNNSVSNYKRTRNGMVGTEYSTKFSTFLSNGCLSPRLIWHELSKYERLHPDGTAGDSDGVYWVKFELLWRDYFRYLVAGNGKKIFLLHGFRAKKDPAIISTAKKSYYDKVWKKDDILFDKWKKGQTGVPLIDASMRELMLTGFLNNRCRQNVASYLAKDLELDWRAGAEWFESILKDHDVYSNYGNWQYGKERE